MKFRAARPVAVGVLVSALCFAVLGARDVPQATSPEALLAEVRALRGDVQANTTATVRAQLLVARLQVQEARVNNVVWQLTEVRRLVSLQESAKEAPLRSLKTAEDGIARGLQGYDVAIATARAELTRIDEAEQPLRRQEADLTTQLRGEQARWSDLNSRLDELERTLPSARR